MVLSFLILQNHSLNKKNDFLFSDGFLTNHWSDTGTATRQTRVSSGLDILFQPGSYVAFQHRFVLQAHNYTHVVVHLHASSPLGDFLRIRLGHKNDASFPWVPVTLQYRTPLEQGGSALSIPMTLLNPTQAPFDRIVMAPFKEVGTASVRISQIHMASNHTPHTEPTTLSVTLNCKAPLHPISPWIYGTYHTSKQAPSEKPPATAYAYGGLFSTRYNWRNNATNLGKTAFYNNTHVKQLHIPTWEHFVQHPPHPNTQTAFTLPIMSYVAKDTYSYAYPIKKYGPQRSVYGKNSDIGNGVDLHGNAMACTSAEETSTAHTPEETRAWMQQITYKNPSFKTKKPFVFLGHNPSQWHTQHYDIQPLPVSYDTLYAQSKRHAHAVHSVWPQAHTVVSNMETPGFLAWILEKNAAENSYDFPATFQGVGFHYTSAYQNYEHSDEDSLQQGRVDTVRDLWDDTYLNPYTSRTQPLRLFSTIRTLLENYGINIPLHITHYSFGGEEHPSGLIAHAEALGRFAQHNVTSAFYEGPLQQNSSVHTAFNIYRNFDGHGASFLEYFLESASPKEIRFFASSDITRKHIVAVYINTHPTQVHSLNIWPVHCNGLFLQKVYQTEGHNRIALSDHNLESNNNPWVFNVMPYTVAVFDFYQK